MAGEALVPTGRWIAASSPTSALKDAIAGMVLSILLVPQAMAYAQLAGLPPQMGLFAALTPALLYLFFGTSPFVSVGPVALVSLVIGEAVGSGSLDPRTGAAVIAIEAGVLLVILGGLGLGRLVNFISEPVLLGFTAAAAVLIAASQLPTLLGMEVARAGNLPAALSALWQGLSGIQPATTAIGLSALAALLIANRYAAPLLWKIGVRPPFRLALAKSLPLLVIVVAAIAASASDARIPSVEAIEGGLPSLFSTFPPFAAWLALLPSAVAVAIIVFVTATAVAKALAGEDRSDLDTSREAVALGAGNIAAALTGGYAVGASLSRSALVKDSGGTTPIASVIASLAIVAVLFFLAPLLAYLPETALAALVISAVFGLVNPREIAAVWKHDRIEAAIILVAFLATLAFGVRLGLAAGALAGLAHYLWFTSVPRVTRVGTDDGGVSYRSIERDEVELTTLPCLIIRIDRSIYFANATYCEEQFFKQLSHHEDVTSVVLDMSAVNDIDASGLAMLRRLVQRLKSRGIALHFAAQHQPIAECLSTLDREVCQIHRTVGHAVERCGVNVEQDIAPT